MSNKVFLALRRPQHLLVLAVVGLAFLPAVARAQRGDASISKNSPQVLNAFKSVEAKAKDSTVRICCDEKDTVLGTIVGPDGFILTKASELKGKIICKLCDGRALEAKVVGVQENYDLAMLKVEAKNLKSVVWVESKTCPVGNWVASAAPADEVPLAVGVVSVAVREGGRIGSPPPRDPALTGYLGIQLEPSDDGPKLARVDTGLPADKAGLKKNDVILTLNGTKIKEVEDFMTMMQGTKPGDVITLKIKRGDEELEIKPTLAKRPATPGGNRGDVQNHMGGDLSNRKSGFPKFLQHDTILKPSEVGGPLVDLDGKAVGINIARAGRTESYAIPSEALLPLLGDLQSGKLAPKEDTTAKDKQAELEKKVADMKSSFEKAEKLKLDMMKKAEEAKAALDKAEKDKTAAEKKSVEAKDALEKAEAELKKLKK